MLSLIKYSLFLFLIFALLSCTSSEEVKEPVQTTLFPEKIYEGEEITIMAIDSLIGIDIKKDSLFFKAYFEMQNPIIHSKVQIVRFVNGKGKLTIPKGTAYFWGSFYTPKEYEDVNYIRTIWDKSTDKPVPNAFGHSRKSKTYLEKELSNYPNNLLAYSEAAVGISENFFMGRVSDTVLFEKAKEYLTIVQQKANLEKPSDLRSLVNLYALSNDFENAQRTLLYLYNKYPESQDFAGSYYDYFGAESLLRENEKNYGKFLDSLKTRIANEHPTSFCAYVITGEATEGSPNIKGFNKNDLLKNIDSYAKFRSEDILVYLSKAKINLELGNITEAKKGLQDYVDAINDKQFIHYFPDYLLDKAVSKDTFRPIALQLSAKIEEATGNVDKAFYALDSAYTIHDIGDPRYRNYGIEQVGIQKASLQKKVKQYEQALKTYEIVYKETRRENVVDSIRVLFEETEQEKGFDAYVKNFKNEVENADNGVDKKTKKAKKLAANFSIKDMSGYEIKLSEWKGRVVVLNFWANYCIPCAWEVPHINKVWRETQTKDIIFLAVTKDSPLVVQRFAQRQKEMFSFSILPNAKELFDVYDLNLVPATIVINKKGEIVHRESGFSKQGKEMDKLNYVIQQELKK